MLQRRVKWSGCGCALGGEEENSRVDSEQVAVHHLSPAKLSSALGQAAGSSSSPELGAPWEAVVLCPMWLGYRNPATGWMLEKPGESS